MAYSAKGGGGDGGGRSRRGDPHSSRAAGVDTEKQFAQILTYLREHKYGCAVAVAQALDTFRDFISSRFRQMEERGWIRLLGEMRCPNEKGNLSWQQVWARTETEIDMDALKIKPPKPKDPFIKLMKRLRKMLPRMPRDQRQLMIEVLEESQNA